MKRVIIPLIIGGLSVSGDCFAVRSPLTSGNGNNAGNKLQEVENIESRNSPDHRTLSKPVVKMCTAAAMGAAVTASFLIPKIPNVNFLKKHFSFVQLELILQGIDSFKNDTNQKNIAGFSAKFVGAIAGSESVAYLFNRDTYYAGLGTSILFNNSWNKIPKLFKIIWAYKLTLRGIKSCTGKEVGLLSTARWLLNRSIVNRILKWSACASACCLEKICSTNGYSKKVSNFFDDHPSLGDFALGAKTSRKSMQKQSEESVGTAG